MGVVLYKRIRSYLKHKPRRFINPGIDTVSFFTQLKSQKVDYVVLRWWESLPMIGEGEDIDLLISNEHLKHLDGITTRFRLKRNLQKVDVYTSGGSPGTDFKKVPYYPEHLATRILARAVFYRDIFRVPSPEDYFLSLCYHAVYHKGYSSGLISLYREEALVADHDYYKHLASLSNCISYQGGYSLEELDQLLGERGWRPPLDTLEKLAFYNPWLLDHFFSNLAKTEKKYKGLCTFVLRSKVDELDCYEDIKKIIDLSGFEILLEHKLTDTQVQSATSQIRGGNWNKGPYAKSGGAPAYLIVAQDLFVEEPPRREDNKFYFLENYKIVKAKNRVREWINKSLVKTDRCNILHSSDRPDQALHYVEIVDPSLLEMINRKVEILANQYDLSKFRIREKLSRNEKRAEVFLIDHLETRAVLKIYRPGAIEYFENEVLMISAGLNMGDFAPKLIEVGKNFFISEECSDFNLSAFRISTFKFCYCDISTLKFLKIFSQQLFISNMYFIDLHEDNILCKDGCFKVIDFEFAGFYEKGLRPKTLMQSYTLAGVPKDFAGRLPFTTKRYDQRNGLFSYEKTGLSLLNFCYGNIVTWHIERLFTLPFFIVVRYSLFMFRKITSRIR